MFSRNDWDDETWNPDKEGESVSSLEEDVTKEVDTDSDDDDYVPSVCLQYALFCVSADTTSSSSFVYHPQMSNSV